MEGRAPNPSNLLAPPTHVQISTFSLLWRFLSLNVGGSREDRTARRKLVRKREVAMPTSQAYSTPCQQKRRKTPKVQQRQVLTSERVMATLGHCQPGQALS